MIITTIGKVNGNADEVAKVLRRLFSPVDGAGRKRKLTLVVVAGETQSQEFIEVYPGGEEMIEPTISLHDANLPPVAKEQIFACLR